MTFKQLTAEWQYLILLGTILFASYHARKHNIFAPIYSFIAKKVKSKRAVIAITSAVSGVLPINGRVAVSAGVLNTMAPNDDRRKKYGVIDYLATHHFYFWSPLEQTIIVPMAVLGMSYWEVLGRTWTGLATIIICALWYIFGVLKEEDVEIDLTRSSTAQDLDGLKEFIKGIKTLGLVGLIIVISNIIGYNEKFFNDVFESAKNHHMALLGIITVFVLSFILGSSEKFVGFGSLATKVFGINYFPLFFAVAWGGYFLSPAHKCLAIGRQIFGTDLKTYYKVLSGIVVAVIAVATIHALSTGL